MNIHYEQPSSFSSFKGKSNIQVPSFGHIVDESEIKPNTSPIYQANTQFEDFL